jgi:hypothetical protein
MDNNITNHNNTSQSFVKPQTSEHRNNNNKSLWISTFINTYYLPKCIDTYYFAKTRIDKYYFAKTYKRNHIHTYRKARLSGLSYRKFKMKQNIEGLISLCSQNATHLGTI